MRALDRIHEQRPRSADESDQALGRQAAAGASRAPLRPGTQRIRLSVSSAGRRRRATSPSSRAPAAGHGRRSSAPSPSASRGNSRSLKRIAASKSKSSTDASATSRRQLRRRGTASSNVCFSAQRLVALLIAARLPHQPDRRHGLRPRRRARVGSGSSLRVSVGRPLIADAAHRPISRPSSSPSACRRRTMVLSTARGVGNWSWPHDTIENLRAIDDARRRGDEQLQHAAVAHLQERRVRRPAAATVSAPRSICAARRVRPISVSALRRQHVADAQHELLAGETASAGTRRRRSRSLRAGSPPS